MLACLDAHDSERTAAACVVLRRWDDSAPADEHVRMLPAARPYRPGSFYERELPALLAVLEVVRDPLEVVLVDGYVWLGEGRAGLGAHLYEALGRRVAVVGVAKSAFRGATGAEQVLRGTSRRPLWVTAAGMGAREAAAAVLGMAGAHRIPDMLRRADLLARQALRGGDLMDVHVDCYAGHRGEETPRRFDLGGRAVEVLEVVDRWYGPDHRYFKVRGGDGAIYILRHDEPKDQWELVVMTRES